MIEWCPRQVATIEDAIRVRASVVGYRLWKHLDVGGDERGESSHVDVAAVWEVQVIGVG